MKKQIRSGVFETNSSSIHCVCINLMPINKLSLPKELYFTPAEFGWEHEEYSDSLSKASYLYTLIVENDLCEECFPKIIEILGRYGVEAKITAVECITEILDDKHTKYAAIQDPNDEFYSYGVDHCYEKSFFPLELVEDEQKLMSYLFDSNSILETTNDNGGPELEVDPSDYDLVYNL